MPLKCLIAEDDLLERDLLEVLLRSIADAQVAAVCENGLAALHYLRSNAVDVVFTDVDMPQVSGIHLLKSLPHPPVFVFVSAHSEYAVAGYDLDVADFIAKPVTLPRLLKAFAKAKEHVARRQTQQPPQAPPEDGVFFVRTDEGLRKLAVRDIVCAESKANFSLLYLRDGTKQLVLVGLKGLGEQLPGAQFVRVHKNFLINWEQVLWVQRETLALNGGLQVPVGDVYRAAVTAQLAGARILKRRPEL